MDVTSTERYQVFKARADQLGLSDSMQRLFEDVYEPIAAWIQREVANRDGPFLLGVNGAQGSGKSTFCALMESVLEAGYGLHTVTMSIDDVYHTRPARMALAERIHPLCSIRGVPGTHDLTLAFEILTALKAQRRGQLVSVPRFDKALDDRLPNESWTVVERPADVILFEGWCVGCRSIPPWSGPINAREARDDPNGVWINWSRKALENEYQTLFEKLDALLMIKVPSMETVRQSRWLQEEKLRRASAARKGRLAGLMTRDEVIEYVALFERYTNHMLETLPALADVLITRQEHFEYTLVTALPS